MAIPLVADTKQRRKVSRETKRRERQEKTAENEHDVRSIKIGLYILLLFSDFSVRCVSSGRVINRQTGMFVQLIPVRCGRHLCNLC